MKYIAIDIGSSFVKSAVLDLDACAIAAEKKFPSPPRAPSDNSRHFEVPAGRYVDMARKLVDDYAVRFDDIAGILLATQMHGFVYATPGREDRYVSWQDLRCLDPMREGGPSYMQHLAEMFPPDEMTRAGVYIKPSLGLCNLYALLGGDSSLPKNGTLFTIGSYIINSLVGANVCHLSNAAPLGMVDVVDSVWNRPLLEKAGLGEVALPELAAKDFQVCGVMRSGGRDIPVHPDFGDQQASILGCLPEANDAVINIATGAQVVMPMDAFRPGPYEVRPYFEKRYINTISNMPAGRGLDVLVNFIRQAATAAVGKDVPAEAVWRAVHDGFVLDPKGLSVDTCFYPVPSQLNGGSVSGISPSNLDLSSLFSAAFTDMARMYWENIQTLAGDAPVARLVCSGGVSWKNPELLTAIRRTTGKECVLSPIPDESMSGLFRAALVASGRCANLRDKPELKLKRG